MCGWKRMALAPPPAHFGDPLKIANDSGRSVIITTFHCCDPAQAVARKARFDAGFSLTANAISDILAPNRDRGTRETESSAPIFRRSERLQSILLWDVKTNDPV